MGAEQRYMMANGLDSKGTKCRLMQHMVVLSAAATLHQPAHAQAHELPVILPTETSVLRQPGSDASGTQVYTLSQEESADWMARYAAGQRIAKTGTTLGYVGAAGLIGGTAIGFVGIATTGFGTDLLVPGLFTAIAGGVGLWTGAGIAAYGTSKSHRALADGDLIGRWCGSCVVSWVALVPIPLTLWAGIPASYLTSSSHRDTLQARYDSYRAGHTRYQPTLKLTPIATRSGPGLGVAGEF